jgi:regulator of replication initiation timing
MKNIYEVLRQKELDLARLEKEVEALRLAAPLLADEKETVAIEATNNKPALATSSASQQPIRIPQPAINPNPQPARASGWEDTAKRWP